MFPGRPGRPLPPYPPMPLRRRPPFDESQPYNRTKTVISMFQDQEGNLDLEKLTTTAQQINSLYGQVSPLISQFFKR